MALIVEDGTGLSTAESYISVSYANTYHTERGNSTWTGSDTLKEQALRRASQYLTHNFTWLGLPYNGRTQALAWPRKGVVDAEGYDIEETELPYEVKYACAEIALRELVTPGTMSPDVTVADKVKSETVGPLSVEYALPNMQPQSSIPVLTAVMALIAPYVFPGSGNGLSGSVSR